MVATGTGLGREVIVGVGELVHVGVVDGTVVGDVEGVVVADAAVAVRRAAPGGAAAGTVGSPVSVGVGVDDGLATGLGV